MKTVKRTLPYGYQLVNAAALEVADSVSRDATRNRETGQIIATVRVFDNESRVAFTISEAEEGRTGITIEMLCPSPTLSDEGESRTLNCLADSMEQLMENELGGRRKKEAAERGTGRETAK